MKYEIGPRTIIGAILLATGAVCLVAGIRIVYKANVSMHWPMTDGRIAVSRLEEVPGDDTLSRPYIVYSFSVGKDSYYSSHVAFPWGGSERTIKALKIIARYPVGKTSKVYYNPANPWESVLAPGESSCTWDTVAISILCLFFGRLIYCNPRKKAPTTETADIRVHVQFRLNLLSACLWILSGMIMARMFVSYRPALGPVATGIIIILGICAEAFWQRSWRVLLTNLEGVIGVTAWQIVLTQCGVTNLSLDILTFIVASTAVAYHKSKDTTADTRSRPAGDDTAHGHTTSDLVDLTIATGQAAQDDNLNPMTAGGRKISLNSVARRSLFYMLAGGILFIAMMILRQWAEDDGSRLQPMYAWLAAVAFLVIVAGAIYRISHWRCAYCGAPLPDSSERKTDYIQCQKCQRINHCNKLE